MLVEGENKPKKIFLITVDALRYDIIDQDIVSTPNMEEIKHNGLDFTRAFSNGCATAQVFPAILFSSSKNDGSGAPGDKKSIADYLSDGDYETIGLTSNPHTSSYNNYDQGFDIFKDYIKPGSEQNEKVYLKYLRKAIRRFDFIFNFWRGFRTKHSLPYKRAEKLNEDVFSMLEQGKNQFFWLHYMDTHGPYSPPKNYGLEMCPEAFKERDRLTNVLYSNDVEESNSKKLWQLYLAETKYLDDKIGELLNRLEDKDEEFLIIFTSDHGEEFGERGNYQHGQFFEFNIHVPLVFYGNMVEGREDDRLASHLDIIPTTLSLLDIEYDKSDIEGLDLLSETRDKLVIDLPDDYVVLTDNWKLMEFDDSYLFDISDDLEEEKNLYNEKKDKVEELKEKVSTEEGLKGIDI